MHCGVVVLPLDTHYALQLVSVAAGRGSKRECVANCFEDTQDTAIWCRSNFGLVHYLVFKMRIKTYTISVATEPDGNM